MSHVCQTGWCRSSLIAIARTVSFAAQVDAAEIQNVTIVRMPCMPTLCLRKGDQPIGVTLMNMGDQCGLQVAFAVCVFFYLV